MTRFPRKTREDGPELTRRQAAIVEYLARGIPEASRDTFFADVMRRLAGTDHIDDDQEITAACFRALIAAAGK